MSLEEKRKEAKARLERASEIEQKHTGPGAEPLAGADLEQVKRLLNEVDALHASIEADEERQGLAEKTQQLLDHYSRPLLPAQPNQGTKGRPADPGSQFVRSASYLEAKNAGLFNSQLNRLEFASPLRDGTSLMEWKATLGRHHLRRGPGAHGRAPRHRGHPAQDHQRAGPDPPGADRVATPSSTSSRRRAPSTCPSSPEATGSALDRHGRAQAGEHAGLPERDGLRAHGGHLAARHQPDAGRRPADPGRDQHPAARRGAARRSRGQVIAGDGTGENLLGILNQPGIQTFATGALNEVDAIFHARTLIRTGAKLAAHGVRDEPGGLRAGPAAAGERGQRHAGAVPDGPAQHAGGAHRLGPAGGGGRERAGQHRGGGQLRQGCTISDREQAPSGWA